MDCPVILNIENIATFQLLTILTTSRLIYRMMKQDNYCQICMAVCTTLIFGLVVNNRPITNELAFELIKFV